MAASWGVIYSYTATKNRDPFGSRLTYRNVVLPDDLELVGFGDYCQPAPGAMQLADGIYILNHALLAIVAVILTFEVDDSYLLTYLVGTLFLLFCLVHIVMF